MDPINGTRYGFVVRLEGVGFGAALEGVRSELAGQGFEVLSEVDLQAILEERLGHELWPYVILAAASPDLARRAVDADPHAGLLLPANVVVQDSPEGAVTVSVVDPEVTFGAAEDAALAEVAAEAAERLRRVVARLHTIETWPGDSVPGWDEVDEASWESFPASDPPSR